MHDLCAFSGGGEVPVGCSGRLDGPGRARYRALLRIAQPPLLLHGPGTGPTMAGTVVHHPLLETPLPAIWHGRGKPNSNRTKAPSCTTQDAIRPAVAQPAITAVAREPIERGTGAWRRKHCLHDAAASARRPTTVATYRPTAGSGFSPARRLSSRLPPGPHRFDEPSNDLALSRGAASAAARTICAPHAAPSAAAAC